MTFHNGPKWDRTTDPRVISTVLYRLSYGPAEINMFKLLAYFSAAKSTITKYLKYPYKPFVTSCLPAGIP